MYMPKQNHSTHACIFVMKEILVVKQEDGIANYQNIYKAKVKPLY